MRVEDFDGRGGWSRFQETRRRFRGAPTLGERRDAAMALVEVGLALLGEPVEEGEAAVESPVVRPDQLRLVAYEVLAEE